MKERIVFHIDVNNAFLSWTATLLLKQGYKQDIRKIPSIICGDEKERRGIVLAKSPIAKKFGIVTAETIYSAKKKCPSLQTFPPNYEWYSKNSKALFKYLSQYSPHLEQFSIDECFKEMTGTSYLYKDYKELAYKIKEEVKEKFGFTVNIGIANNKLCAKMASDFEKPDKVHTLFKNEIEEKLWPLDVGELFMVGNKTKEQLNKINIYTIKDLALANDNLLEKHFKNQAKHLKEAAWGIDNSKVEPRSNKRDSISTTETLNHDYTDETKLKEILFRQADEVSRQLRNQGEYASTVAVIFKNNQFINYSAQAKLPLPSNNTKDIYMLAIKIFDENYKKDPIRLIGIRLSSFTNKKEEQISLFSEEQSTETVENDEFQRTIDKINNKFGKSIVSPASLKFINNSNPGRKKLNKS